MIDWLKSIIKKPNLSNREDKVPDVLYHVTYFIKKDEQPYWAQTSLPQPPSLKKDDPFMLDILQGMQKKWELADYDSFGAHVDVEWKNGS